MESRTDREVQKGWITKWYKETLGRNKCFLSWHMLYTCNSPVFGNMVTLTSGCPGRWYHALSGHKLRAFCTGRAKGECAYLPDWGYVSSLKNWSLLWVVTNKGKGQRGHYLRGQLQPHDKYLPAGIHQGTPIGLYLCLPGSHNGAFPWGYVLGCWQEHVILFSQPRV